MQTKTIICMYYIDRFSRWNTYTYVCLSTINNLYNGVHVMLNVISNVIYKRCSGNGLNCVHYIIKNKYVIG